MNGAEQRQRHTAVTSLETRLDDAAAVLEVLDTRLSTLAEVVHIIDDRQVEVGKATATAYDALSHRVDVAMAGIRTFEVMTFWQRVKWLFTGELA